MCQVISLKVERDSRGAASAELRSGSAARRARSVVTRSNSDPLEPTPDLVGFAAVTMNRIQYTPWTRNAAVSITSKIHIMDSNRLDYSEQRTTLEPSVSISRWPRDAGPSSDAAALHVARAARLAA